MQPEAQEAFPALVKVFWASDTRTRWGMIGPMADVGDEAQVVPWLIKVTTCAEGNLASAAVDELAATWRWRDEKTAAVNRLEELARDEAAPYVVRRRAAGKLDELKRHRRSGDPD
jgi:hypothetical protein